MKKLMIMAALVGAATLAQASVAKWSASNVYTESTIGTKDPVAAANYKALYFYAANTLGDHVLSQEDAIKYLNGTTEGGVTALAAKAAKTGKVASTGALSATDARTSGTMWGSGDSIQGYAIILNTTADDFSGATKYMITALSSVQNFNTTKDTKTLSLGTQASNSWSDIAGGSVPEPTSAMLLLLGVAGLALKRKVA